MSKQKYVYKNPQPGQPLITTISSGCVTPILSIKFCCLVRPFCYANSTIPRYSITCIIDPKVNREFLTYIQTIEKNENIPTIIKNETIKEGNEHFNTGNMLIKFQSKEKIPVFLKTDTVNLEPLELEDEIAKGEKVSVTYSILRYTKKNTMNTEHGISFKPSCIHYYSSREINQEKV